MQRFILDGKYKDLLEFFSIDTEEVLQKAGLSPHALNARSPRMSEEEYYRFWNAIEEIYQDDTLPLKLATVNKIETFSPPIFAAFCSKNGTRCFETLSRYKRLISPMRFDIIKEKGTVMVEIDSSDGKLKMPKFLIISELTFLTNILRKGTLKRINPVKVETGTMIENETLNEYFGTDIRQSKRNAISFKASDLREPFYSHNINMLEYLEPGLLSRLEELNAQPMLSKTLKELIENRLPGGFSIYDAAKELHLSPRTLQRKLKDENTTFSELLGSVRKKLAVSYIDKDMNVNDIAFMLGYGEVNSFLRMFKAFTGKSVKEYRKDTVRLHT